MAVLFYIPMYCFAFFFKEKNLLAGSYVTKRLRQGAVQRLLPWSREGVTVTETSLAKAEMETRLDVINSRLTRESLS
jgi:hypothetical protein